MHIFVAKSSNAKTGPIPVTYSAESTCSPVCPLKGAGCYAELGPVSRAWKRASGPDALDMDALRARIAALPAGTLWRHNVAGDLPHRDGVIDAWRLGVLIGAAEHTRGFTYTHHDMRHAANRRAVSRANRGGFTVNLSANNPAHADALADTGVGPVVTVLPAGTEHAKDLHTPHGRRIVVCPAVTREAVTCATCMLCARPDRKTVVGFPAHGTRKRAASSIAETA